MHEPVSSKRKFVEISLIIIGFSLFVIGGALGIARVNDPKVVEGEPRIQSASMSSGLLLKNPAASHGSTQALAAPHPSTATQPNNDTDNARALEKNTIQADKTKETKEKPKK